MGVRFRVVPLALVAAMISTFASTGQAKEKAPPPPPPCPLTAILRVPDAASLEGLQSLSGCSPDRIVIAPASASEFGFPQRQSIAPDGLQPRMASDTGAPRRTPDVVRIRPERDEPIDALTTAAAIAPPAGAPAAATQADAILAMRPVSYATRHDPVISAAARRHRIDPLFLHAVIKNESAYRENATSHAGARGLMQLMPGTARSLGVRAITHPESNVDGGARLLRRLYGKFNDFTLTLAAYNAGEGAVAKYGNRTPPYAETQNYVRKVMDTYHRLLAEQTGIGR